MLDDFPDEWPALVASAGQEHFTPMLDVGSSPTHVPSTRLQAALAGKQFPFAASAEFYSETAWQEIAEFLSAKTDTGVTFEAQGRRTRSMLAEHGTALIVVENDGYQWNEWTVTIAAEDRKMANTWLQAIGALLPEPPPPPPPEPLPHNIIPVRFWMQDPHTREAYSRRRNITVQPWAEVESNYNAKVRAELGSLMKMDTCDGGKLILMHGPAGTGKTRTILSMMSEWRNWCTASVVTDADKFFGDPSYINSVAFGSENMAGWLMLVLEDADEFIAVKGRETKGQAIARLLNLADGIVGQGLNLLTVMTTNVNVDELNPALIRSGRCMANIHVGPFEAAEASTWLAEKGVTAEVDQPTVLADLYERVRQSQV